MGALRPEFGELAFQMAENRRREAPEIHGDRLPPCQRDERLSVVVQAMRTAFHGLDALPLDDT